VQLFKSIKMGALRQRSACLDWNKHQSDPGLSLTIASNASQ